MVTQNDTTVHTPSRMFYPLGVYYIPSPAKVADAKAWFTLVYMVASVEDWQQRGRPQYEASPDELMNACVCGNDPEYCTCPVEEADDE